MVELNVEACVDWWHMPNAGVAGVAVVAVVAEYDVRLANSHLIKRASQYPNLVFLHSIGRFFLSRSGRLMRRGEREILGS